MMPSTSVSPAAIRNSINPSCRPFSACSAASAAVTASLHRAFVRVGVGVILEDRADGAVGDAALRILLHHAQVVVLHGVVVPVELEGPAHRLEIGGSERRAQRFLVV